LHRRQHHALVDDVFGAQAEIAVRVLLHVRDHQLLIQRAAVDADADRLGVVPGNSADGRELLVAPLARADVPGIDAVLVERRRARRVAGEKQVAVVVEVADERGGDAGIEHPLLDFRDGFRRWRKVHGHPDHFRSRLGQLDALLRRGYGVCCIGHRHRLDDDWRTSANLNRTDAHADRLVKFENRHGPSR
jgi:hypothetical protein